MHRLRAWLSGFRSAPRWVKVFGIIVIALVLLFVILALTGVHEPQPGGHGP